MPFEQTAEWWDGPSTHDPSRRNAELYAWELHQTLGGVTHGGWEKRRASAVSRFGVCKERPDGVVFTHLLHGAAAKAHVNEVPVGDMPEPETELAHDKQVAVLKEQYAAVNRKYRLAVKQENLYERLAASLSGLVPVLEPLPPSRRPVSLPAEAHESALLRIADWHSDEIVSPVIMEGLNAYGPYIVARRVQYVVDSTIGILRRRFAGTAIDTLYIHDFGDDITGALHEENKYTNAFPPIVAVIFAAALKAAFARELAASFPRIVWRRVPGNHWRYTKKMAWKLPTENSDWLISQILKMQLADIPGIEIDAPASWSLYGEIEGHGFSLNHGYSDARGGFAGIPAYSLARSDAKRSATDRRLGRNVVSRDYGHLHDKYELPKAGGGGRINICPSLKGGDEFAYEGMAGTFSDPAQMLSLVNQEHGEWCVIRLDVAQYDSLEECRYDAVVESTNAAAGL